MRVKMADVSSLGVFRCAIALPFELSYLNMRPRFRK